MSEPTRPGRQPAADPRAVTPIFGWHVPVLADPANVPYDINQLATGIEGTFVSSGLGTKHLIVATASTTITASGGATISYGYTFGAIPVVVAVLGDEAPAAARYVIVVNASTNTTTFGVRVKDANGANVTSGAIRINYVALGARTPAAATKPAGEET